MWLVPSLGDPLRREIMEFRWLPGDPSQALVLGFIEQILNRLEKLGKIERLFDQSSRSGCQRREKLAGTAGDDNDRQQGVLDREPLEDGPAVLAGQVQVEQDQIKL